VKPIILAVALLLSVIQPALAENVFMTVSRQVDYKAALDDLSLAIADHHYRIIKIQPVDQGLRHHGYASPNYKVIFFADENQVSEVLDANPRASVLLPLRIFLYQKGKNVVASAARLDMWKGKFGASLDPLLLKWNRDLHDILQDYAAQPSF
jgi:uncharacterized protein (DUF302 family)